MFPLSEVEMKDAQTLDHSIGHCKYHVVFNHRAAGCRTQISHLPLSVRMKPDGVGKLPHLSDGRRGARKQPGSVLRNLTCGTPENGKTVEVPNRPNCPHAKSRVISNR